MKVVPPSRNENAWNRRHARDEAPQTGQQQLGSASSCSSPTSCLFASSGSLDSGSIASAVVMAPARGRENAFAQLSCTQRGSGTSQAAVGAPHKVPSAVADCLHSPLLLHFAAGDAVHVTRQRQQHAMQQTHLNCTKFITTTSRLMDSADGSVLHEHLNECSRTATRGCDGHVCMLNEITM